MLEYNKTSWNDGDVITAEALNKIEESIGNAVDVINSLESNITTTTFSLRNTLRSKGIEVTEDSSITELIEKVSTELGNTADKLGIYHLGDEMESFTGGIVISNKQIRINSFIYAIKFIQLVCVSRI